MQWGPNKSTLNAPWVHCVNGLSWCVRPHKVKLSSQLLPSPGTCIYTSLHTSCTLYITIQYSYNIIYNYRNTHLYDIIHHIEPRTNTRHGERHSQTKAVLLMKGRPGREGAKENEREAHLVSHKQRAAGSSDRLRGSGSPAAADIQGSEVRYSVFRNSVHTHTHTGKKNTNCFSTTLSVSGLLAPRSGRPG